VPETAAVVAKAIQSSARAETKEGQVITFNRNESRTLSALRDALLPKLLAGAVRVRPERMKAEG